MNCSNCAFAKLVPQDITKRFCTGAPPTPVAVPSPQGVQLQMVHPLVEATMLACALYRARVAVVTP